VVERRGGVVKDRYQSIGDLVCETLRRNILEGRYAPGTQLKERDVAQEIGVSTTPVKSALQRLALEGLVSSVPMRGSFVAENVGTQVAEFGLIRAALEGTAASLAAVKVTEEGIGRLRVQLEEMQRCALARDVQRSIQANATFHDVIHEIANNPTLRQITDMVRTYNLALRPQEVLSDEEQLMQAFEEHQGVFSAIERRSPVLADERMRAHVLRTSEYLRSRTPTNDTPR
jgi:DNA-binding GntR family transcriptional regulator